MAAAISQFPESGKENLDLPGFGMISVSEDCTACGACERACPTGALTYSLHEFQGYDLKFLPVNCVACGICQQVCVPDAITIEPHPSFQYVFANQEPVVLIEGEITRCERCSAVMAKKTEVDLCPICQHRREHPFGGPIPERLLRLVKSQAKRETGS
jgi:ferredoxin